MQDDRLEGPPVTRWACTRALHAVWSGDGSGLALSPACSWCPQHSPGVALGRFAGPLGSTRASAFPRPRGPSDTVSFALCVSTGRSLWLPLISPTTSGGSKTSFEGLPPSPVTARLRGLGSQQLPLVSLSWDGSPAQYAGLWTAQRDPEACAYASVRLTGTRSRCLSTACFEALRDSHTFLFFFPPFSNPSESFIYSSVRAFMHLCNTHSFCVSPRSRH